MPACTFKEFREEQFVPDLILQEEGGRFRNWGLKGGSDVVRRAESGIQASVPRGAPDLLADLGQVFPTRAP